MCCFNMASKYVRIPCEARFYCHLLDMSLVFCLRSSCSSYVYASRYFDIHYVRHVSMCAISLTLVICLSYLSLYIYIYICMYVYIHIYTHAYVYIYIYIYIFIYLSIYILISLFAYSLLGPSPPEVPQVASSTSCDVS